MKKLLGFTVSREISALQNIVGGGRHSTRKNHPGSSLWLGGFTLIELLVVISIIGILAAVITTNFVAARDRAYDAKAKANLLQFKTSLHLYYTDYHKYPVSSSANTKFNGCGTNGTDPCPVCASAYFAAGGPTGCQRIYADRLELSGNMLSARYYQCDSGDDYRIKVSLTNKSDVDVAESQKNCPDTNCVGVSSATLNYNADKDYVLCGTQ